MKMILRSLMKEWPDGQTDNERSVKGILRLKRHVGAVLHLQDDRRLDDLHRMPLAGGDVDAVFSGFRIQ